jgi:mannose-1-phosphate guanylyltransferase
MKVIVVADNSAYIERSYSLFTSLTRKVYVQCPVSSSFAISDYVPSDHIWTEPKARGTATAVGLAALRALEEDPDELLIFAYANQVVTYEAKLLHTLKIAAELYQVIHKILLIGVAITRETDNYGYIEINKAIKEMYDIVAFEMKSFRRYPNKEEITRFVKSWKYLWDTGYLLGTAKDVLRAIEETAPELYDNLLKINTSKNFEESLKILETIPYGSVANLILNNIDVTSVAVVPVDLGQPKLFEEKHAG